MDVQVIWKQGEPEYAVLPWAEFQQLLRDAGRDGKDSPQPLQARPVAGAAVPLAALRSMREDRNMTLQALAREAGISPSYLEMIESGEREPSPVLLRALGRIFDVQQWDI